MLRFVTLMMVLGVTAPAFAGPCTTPGRSCVEWMTLGEGQGRSLVYRTHPLTTRNPRITRALVVVHGSDRNADAAFRVGVTAARLAGALDDTIVIAPRFASRDGLSCRDVLGPGEIGWPCEGNSWRSGGAAAGTGVTSFDFADEILRTISAKAIFPNLGVIVVSGHSAGGQFVTRYEMANRVHESIGVPVKYVVANPSSYAYPDGRRPLSAKGVKFGPVEGSACDSYDSWPYGLDDRRGYVEQLDVTDLKRQLASRPTTYLLGGQDVIPVDGFDASCAAMAQGPTRLARGQAFAAYVNQRLGAHHAVVMVPECGHDLSCMFTAESARPILFPTRR